MEAGIKLAVFGIVALAFFMGGVSGFAGALTALVFLTVVVAVAGLAGFENRNGITFWRVDGRLHGLRIRRNFKSREEAAAERTR